MMMLVSVWVAQNKANVWSSRVIVIPWIRTVIHAVGLFWTEKVPCRNRLWCMFYCPFTTVTLITVQFGDVHY